VMVMTFYQKRNKIYRCFSPRYIRHDHTDLQTMFIS
jgi:hypothetical protein